MGDLDSQKTSSRPESDTKKGQEVDDSKKKAIDEVHKLSDSDLIKILRNTQLHPADPDIAPQIKIDTPPQPNQPVNEAGANQQVVNDVEKSRYLIANDPLTKVLREALAKGNVNEAKDEAERILGLTLQKRTIGGRPYGGEGSVEHAYDLYKIAAEFDYYSTGVFVKTDSREIFSLTKKYSEDGIKAIKTAFTDKANKSPEGQKANRDVLAPELRKNSLLAKQLTVAARACDGTLETEQSLAYYVQAKDIYENIFKIQNSRTVGPQFLEEMIDFYNRYSAFVSYHSNPTYDSALDQKIRTSLKESPLLNNLGRRRNELQDLKFKMPQ